MSARPRWRLVGVLSAAIAAAFAVGLASPPAAAAEPPKVTPAAATVSTHQAAASSATYLVRWRDTLFQISARFCGQGSSYPWLAAASGIVNPDRIYAGRTKVVLACTKTTKTKASTSQATTQTGRDKRIATVVAHAKAQVGKWYRWGTAGPNTYDCSGLVLASYARAGVHLSHYSGAMRRQGRAVPLRQLLPGDVLWHPGHVVMYIGNGRIVEAPHSGARVRIRALRILEWSGARRMI